MMFETIKNLLGPTIWGIIAIVANLGICGIAAGLAYLSLKIWPPKEK